MLRNYLKVALRNLAREKLYTFVNVFGLAVGVAACLLIMLFVRHEWSYDRFHSESDRLYRAWGREDWGDGREFFYTITPIPLAEALESAIPEVESTVRVRAFRPLVGPEGSRFTENLRMVDTTFFDVFDFRLRDGRLSSDPNSVVITPETARKYFGAEPAIGQTLTIEIVDEPQDYLVTGIVERPPQNSSIQFDVLIPFTEAPDLINPNALTSWFNIFVETYVLLDDRASQEVVEAKLPAMVADVLGESAEESGYELGLQPITDIHLGVDYPVGIEPISDPVYSYFLAGIALLVLVVASINFVTLSIGQSARRVIEVGIRKSMGAGKMQLLCQFWGEAFLVVALSVAAGVLLARGALPMFSDLTGSALTLATIVPVATSLALMTLGIALLAGVYPALLLSGLGPADVLRGRTKISGDRSVARRGLVVVQFSISILMIVATLFVVRQLDYVQEKQLGFDREQVVVLRTNTGATTISAVSDRLDAALVGHPAVRSLAYSAFSLSDPWARFGFETNDGSHAEVMANLISPTFLDVMNIKPIAGRGFDTHRAADSTAMVVNEAFVREFGFGTPQAALGRGLPSASFGPHEIIGVVPDFNFESLHSAVRPLVLVQTGEWLFRGSSDINVASSMQRDISVRIAPGNPSASIELLEEVWTRVAPDQPFEFFFLDEAIDARYRQEERLSRIVAAASVLAILIACLGLFSLAALTVVRRRKEIGVRKVLGATVSNIVVLLARDFTMLVGIAFVIAAPVAYVLVSNWLERFAYRVDVGALTFLIAGLLAFALAVATVIYHAIRAALTDPVKSLRYE